MLVDVHLSYAQDDEALGRELAAHLALLAREGRVRAITDARVGLGEDVDRAIRARIDEAEVIVLLVSASFLASDACWDLEMMRALERARGGEAAVIPVLARACDWTGAPFAILPIAPEGGRPVTSWPNRDEAWASVAAAVRAAAVRMDGRAPIAPRAAGGRIAIGDYEATMVREGAYPQLLVQTRAAMPEAARRRPAPVRLLPRPVGLFVDRSEAIAQLDAVRAPAIVEVYGAPGMGRTALLRRVAHFEDAAARFADGVVYLPAARKALEDLLLDLYDAFYERDPAQRPTRAQIAHALQGVAALVLLDDVGLARDDLQALLDAMPRAAVIFSGGEARLPGDAKSIRVEALSLSDSIALVRAALEGVAIEMAEIEAICRTIGGRPQALLEAAAQLRNGERTAAAIAQSGESAVHAASRLSARERRLVAILAAAGVVLVARQVFAWAEIPSIGGALRELVARHLVEVSGDGVSIAAGAVHALSAEPGFALDASDPARLAAWVRASGPEEIARSAEGLARLLETVVGSLPQAWDGALALARSLDAPLAYSGRWGAWRSALRAGLTAAEALGDQGARAWALHQLGARALCLGEPEAAALLREALAAWRAIGDAKSAAVTERLLGLIGGPADARKPRLGRALLLGLGVGLGVAAIAVAVAGRSIDGERVDGGGVAEDASADEDAGDSGNPPTHVDAGRFDAGAARDAGAVGRDAGVIGRDAGASERDAGASERDAGVPARDAGILTRDAGVPARDAGRPTLPINHLPR